MNEDWERQNLDQDEEIKHSTYAEPVHEYSDFSSCQNSDLPQISKRRLSDVTAELLSDEQKSQEYIQKLLARNPDLYEQPPTGTYAELVAAQIEHERIKQERIQKVRTEAIENLRRLQEISGIKPQDNEEPEHYDQVNVVEEVAKDQQVTQKKKDPWSEIKVFVEKATKKMEENVDKVLNKIDGIDSYKKGETTLSELLKMQKLKIKSNRQNQPTVEEKQQRIVKDEEDEEFKAAIRASLNLQSSALSEVSLSGTKVFQSVENRVSSGKVSREQSASPTKQATKPFLINQNKLEPYKGNLENDDATGPKNIYKQLEKNKTNSLIAKAENWFDKLRI